jgi:ArsR family transcriptional regulator, arsenate/arsenite/antimonite-responsive transcriptional repressor
LRQTSILPDGTLEGQRSNVTNCKGAIGLKFEGSGSSLVALPHGGLVNHVKLDIGPYFWKYGNMSSVKASLEEVTRYADMFSAMGTEPRLRIMQLLLSAHPEGLVVTEIQQELEIPNSTLSHHLDKLKSEDLVEVTREGTFLRYTANVEALQSLLRFLYAECCKRSKAIKPQSIVQLCR